ncbi:MAG: hypothetical protein J6Z02_09065 [Lachnospiraceae bacterium]|nr:hypothetical protein [Lachnospiraceae bacterium]
MKVVYFGSDVFLPCFEFFLREHEVLALYTYHNDEDYIHEYTIIDVAAEHGIPVYYESITEDDIRRYIKEDGCGLFFIAEYDRKVPVPSDMPEFRGINTHSSLLPEGRSYYPIECAMEKELPETGVTMHKITNLLDSGDILAQEKVAIEDDMDSVDVYLKNAENAENMLKDIMADLEGAWEKGRAQGTVTKYWNRPAKELLTITHDMCVKDAVAMFRKFNSMTEVTIGGKVHFITSVMPGKAKIAKDEMRLRHYLWMYRLKDGHIRVNVREKNQENRK